MYSVLPWQLPCPSGVLLLPRCHSTQDAIVPRMQAAFLYFEALLLKFSEDAWDCYLDCYTVRISPFLPDLISSFWSDLVPLWVFDPCVSWVSSFTHPCWLALQFYLCLIQPFVLTFSPQLWSPCPSHPLSPSGYVCHLNSSTTTSPLHSCHCSLSWLEAVAFCFFLCPPFIMVLTERPGQKLGPQLIFKVLQELPFHAQLPAPSLFLPSLCV